MQALSFVVHIPLVCFASRSPRSCSAVESLHLRTATNLIPVWRTLDQGDGRPGSRGAITGTILSFEMGLLAGLHRAIRHRVFGLGFAIEGFSFFNRSDLTSASISTAGTGSPRGRTSPPAFPSRSPSIVPSW